MNIFYFLIIIPILLELQMFLWTKQFVEFKKEVREDGEKSLKKGEVPSKGCFIEIMHFIYMLWCVIGVITSFQWLMFGILLGVSFLTSIPGLSKLKDKVWYTKLDSLVCLGILIFIFINRYFLNIPLI